MNIRHIPDPRNRGNTRGGPVTVIHKHSRAVGFSIFRKHNLFSRPSGNGGYHMNTRFGILLAPRRVQEQFTSTQTTSQLNAHGLLGENRTGDGHRPTSSGGRRESRSRERKDKDRRKSKSKSRNYTSDTGTSSQTASGGSTSTADEVPVPQTANEFSRNRLPSPALPSALISPTVVEHEYPPNPSSSSSVSATTSNTSSTFLSGRTPSPLEFAPSSSNASTSSLVQSPSTTVRNPSTVVRSPQSGYGMRSFGLADPMVLDDEEQTYPRTSHAEAFATLDSNTIEYYRGRSEQRALEDSSSLSNLERWRRKLLGQNNKTSSRPPSGPPSAALDGNYTPPWLTMAPRSKQEERDRVIQNLNESFKDVGLLPSFRTNRSDRAKTKRSNKAPSSVNVFATIPADSLYMLLPLWPAETDPASAHEQANVIVPDLPLEERQYLIVYYVPFEKRGKAIEKAKKVDANKKRTRGETSTANDPSSVLKQANTFLTFRVCARLVGYDEFHGTGVRIPADGLSVTGPMSEAMHFLPPDSIRHECYDDVVIAYCHSRESGIEFLPEGLTKLGLCMPSTPASPALTDEDEREVFLTPIGRAVVEMAWLGCMAMTSFGPIPFSSK